MRLMTRTWPSSSMHTPHGRSLPGSTSTPRGAPSLSPMSCTRLPVPSLTNSTPPRSAIPHGPRN
eukprot:4148704-Prymnesium_polylepis.2